MNLTPPFEAKLRAFLNKGPGLFSRTVEIRDKHMTVYLRMFRRHMGTSMPLKLIDTIEIARVDVKPKFQRQGLYSHLLQICGEYNDEYCLYIENVQDTEHYPIYTNRGFSLVPQHGLEGISGIHSEWPRSFFKMPVCPKEV